MRAVMTVTGKDSKGIIAKVSAFLAEKNANIEDISQTKQTLSIFPNRWSANISP